VGTLRAPLRDHWPLVCVLAVGALARILVAVAYRPALFFSDSWAYIILAYGSEHFAPDLRVGGGGEGVGPAGRDDVEALVRELLDERQLCADEAAAVNLIRAIVADRRLADELLESQRARRAHYSRSRMIEEWLAAYERLGGARRL
jgi:hypothetical protein